MRTKLLTQVVLVVVMMFAICIPRAEAYEYDFFTDQNWDSLVNMWESNQLTMDDVRNYLPNTAGSNIVEQIFTYIDRNDQEAAEAYLNELFSQGEIPEPPDQQHTSAANPNSQPTRVGRQTVQSAVFAKAKPKKEMVQEVRTMAGTDLFADFWEYENGYEGTTYGLNPAFTFGEKTQFTVTVPIYMEDPDNSDENYTLGLDGRVKHYITQNFAVGGHINYLNQHTDGWLDFEQDFETITGGPFASYNMPLSERINLSFGGLIDYTERLEDNSDDDGTWLGAAGANLGLSLTDNLALNPFAIYYLDLDAEDNVDDDFVDLGLEVATNLSETWSLSGGFKTVTSAEDYDSYEIYLGSVWQF